MQLLKGFITIQDFINNQPGITSALGELSGWSLTYGKDVRTYKSTTAQTYTLNVFKSLDSAGLVIDVKQSMVDLLFAIVANMVTYSNTHPHPLDKQSLASSLLTDFSGSVSGVVTGGFSQAANGNNIVALPGWITFNTLGTTPTTVKVWLSDTAFRNQYDETEIVVIPPIPNLDDFFLQADVVRNTVTTITPTITATNITNAKAGYPETYLRALAFNYDRPNSFFTTLPVYWHVLIYGAYGDNFDLIKNAITSYIMANTARTRAEWTGLFPTLFKRTEFLLLPRWDHLAIPSMGGMVSTYSPITGLSETLTFVKAKCSSIPVAHVNAYADVMTMNYKSLATACVGGTDNIASKFRIKDFYPDLTNIPTASLDFARMSDATKQTMLVLESLMVAADGLDINGSVPLGMSKVTRDGVLYVATTDNNIQYLVAASTNYGV